MASTSPLISVVIPVHNRPALLARAVRSVQRQSITDWEVIIIDDASTTPVSVPGADGRVRIIRHDRNQGPAAARNTGLAAARGAFTAFLDSDDEWRANKLAAQIAEMRLDERLRVLVSGATVVDGVGPRGSLPFRTKLRGERIASYLYRANQFAQASCIFAPTDFARRLGFESSLRQYEDHLFLMMAEAAGAEVEVSTTPLTRHHVDPRPDRLGRRDNIVRAQEFLNLAANLITPGEKLAFQLRCMSGELPPMDAARLAISALAKRDAPKGAAIKVLTRGIFGASAYAAIRGAGQRAQAVMRSSM